MTRLSGQHIQLDPDAFAVQTTTGVKEALDRLVDKVKRERFEAIEQEAMAHREQFAADAAQIIERAHMEAQQIIASARQDQEKLEAEGREAGFQDGYAQGVAEAQRQTEEMLHRTHALLEAAFRAEAERLAQVTPDIALIIQNLVQRLWEQQFQSDPHLALSNLVRQAIDALMLQGKMSVVLNPDTLTLLQQQPDFVQHAFVTLSERVDFMPDPMLEATSVLLSGATRQDDLQRLWQIDIQHQLEAILPRLLAPLEVDIANQQLPSSDDA
jgi:flagellar biosynthesis/type III secretory pathway protein FliH